MELHVHVKWRKHQNPDMHNNCIQDKKKKRSGKKIRELQ